ncbi:MAG TPA: cytochrome P450, partial [Pseudomonadota bacterium]|nr:cytochrome P450 [Pseudomonadota bacterium]
MQVLSLLDRAIGRAIGRDKPIDVPSGLRLPPLLSGGLPVLGHASDFVTGAIQLLFRAHREHGEICRLNVFHRNMVAMFGPDAHEAVFRAPDTVLNPSEAYKIMTPVFGKGIVYDAPPDKQAEQFKMLLPALKDKRMRTYGEAVVQETEESTRGWGDDGTLDFVEFCRVLTNFTSSRCLLGREFREGMNDEFAAVYHDLEMGVTPLAYLNAHLPIPSFIRRDRARVRLVEMISKITEARRREQRVGEDFLQTLMDAKYQDGRSLTEDEITGLLLAGMFAGHHTSSVTTAWAMIDLLRNPASLKRAIDEVDRVFASGRAVNHAALRELSFLENVVKETLRLHPPLFMLVRVAQTDFTFKDFFIPKGTWILISPTVSHRIPEVFPHPETFDPDRFAPPREEDKRDFAYIAFGGGRHKCLGNAFAILQIKAILALLLGQYEFELAGDPIDSDFHGLVVGPKVPCRIRYSRRANPSVTIAGATALAKLADEYGQAAQQGGEAGKGGCPVAHPSAAQEAAPASKPETEEKADAAAQLKKLTVMLDKDLCQGHAVCAGEAPELFYVAGDGKVALKQEDIPPEQYAKLRAAAKFCPTRAI